VVKSKVFLKPDEITNILTLRYDPFLKSKLPILTWKNFTGNNAKPSLDDIQNIIQNSLRNKIGRSNQKEIAIGLSGGVDSILTLAILKKTFPEIKINAISIKFADSMDETISAKKITQKLDVNHTIIYLENYLSELPKAIDIIKLPFWDLHFYHLAKNAKKNSNYLITGDGGDELFGGYTFRYQKFLSLVNEKSSPLERVKSYLECHQRDWVPDQEKFFNEALHFSWHSAYKRLLQYFDNPLKPIQQVFLADYNGKLLHNWSPLFTKITNHFRIHFITPLLSKELIKYAIEIPPHLKYDTKKNVGKLLLRRLLDNYIDNNLIKETKQGFTVDTLNLWKSYGKKLCKEYLTDAHIVKDNWINQNWINHYIDKKLNVRYVNKFLGLLAFEIWYRLFITKEMRPNTILS